VNVEYLMMEQLLSVGEDKRKSVSTEFSTTYSSDVKKCVDRGSTQECAK
jgi:hypothetical protein